MTELRYEFLTEGEQLVQRKLNVLEAELQQIDRRAEEASQSATEMRKEFERAGSSGGASMTELWSTVQLGHQAFRTVVQAATAFVDVMKSAADQQTGINLLTRAIEQHGIAYSDATERVEEFTLAQQNTTVFGDESTRATIARFASFTDGLDLTLDEILGGAALIQDTMQATGQAGEQMSRIIAQVYAGNLRSLERLIPGQREQILQLREIEDANVRAARGVEILRAAYGGAAAEIDPVTQKLAQFGNDWGDIWQEVGNIINKTLIESGAFEAIVAGLTDIGVWIREEGPGVVEFFVDFVGAVLDVSDALITVGRVGAAIASLGLSELAIAVGPDLIEGIGAGIDGLINFSGVLDEWQLGISDAVATAAESADFFASSWSVATEEVLEDFRTMTEAFVALPTDAINVFGGRPGNVFGSLTLPGFVDPLTGETSFGQAQAPTAEAIRRGGPRGRQAPGADIFGALGGVSGALGLFGAQQGLGVTDVFGFGAARERQDIGLGAGVGALVGETNAQLTAITEATTTAADLAVAEAQRVQEAWRDTFEVILGELTDSFEAFADGSATLFEAVGEAMKRGIGLAGAEIAEVLAAAAQSAIGGPFGMAAGMLVGAGVFGAIGALAGAAFGGGAPQIINEASATPISDIQAPSMSGAASFSINQNIGANFVVIRRDESRRNFRALDFEGEQLNEARFFSGV